MSRHVEPHRFRRGGAEHRMHEALCLRDSGCIVRRAEANPLTRVGVVTEAAKCEDRQLHPASSTGALNGARRASQKTFEEPSPGIAVGTAIADRPPHRSVREVLPHTAPAASRARNRSFG